MSSSTIVPAANRRVQSLWGKMDRRKGETIVLEDDDDGYLGFGRRLNQNLITIMGLGCKADVLEPFVCDLQEKAKPIML